eukprot:scaffold15492_cov49-Cylindrotheca_fusiformis.AAC.1
MVSILGSQRRDTVMREPCSDKQVSRSTYDGGQYGNAGDPFFHERRDAVGAKGSNMKVKLFLSLKTMAYGVPPHNFRDYFQCRED